MGPRQAPKPSEILRGWQHGACKALQNAHKSAQQLHADLLRGSVNAIHHVQEHHAHLAARGTRHAAFASLTTALPIGQPGRHSNRDALVGGQSRNCVHGSLADSFESPVPQPSQPANGNGINDDQGPPPEEEKFTITEIEVTGAEGHLKKAAESALTLKPNFQYTGKDIVNDMSRVLELGWVRRCQSTALPTTDGFKLTLDLEKQPDLKGILIQGANLLPAHVVQDAFQNQRDKTLNTNNLSAGVLEIGKWYADNGFHGSGLLAEQSKIVGHEAQLQVQEVKVGKVNLQFHDKDTGEVKEGRTKPDIIMRHLQTKPGQVWNIRQAHRDRLVLGSLGIFDEPAFFLLPAEDGTQQHPVGDLNIQLKERARLRYVGGMGMSAKAHVAEGLLPGFFANGEFGLSNLFGLNQNTQALLLAAQSHLEFSFEHFDPWIRGDAHRTSRKIGLSTVRSSGGLIHGKAKDGSGAQTQTTGPTSQPNPARLVGGVEYERQLAPQWKGTLGINGQRTCCMDNHFRIMTKDCYNAPLTFSGGKSDTMMMALLRSRHVGQNSSTSITMEQALPLHKSLLNFNRLKVEADRSFPLASDPRFKAYLSGKGGVIMGDLPPYEAFPIGGAQTVRGYDEGAVGSGRNYVAGSAELHFPIKDPIEGTLFLDYGTDLHSGASVPGDPAGMRGKPGNGYGIGVGIRVQTPIVPVRLEYAWNSEGCGRFHFRAGQS